MPYSWKAIGFGALVAVAVMVGGQFLIDMFKFEVSNLVLGGIAGMAGAYTLGQINDKDKK